MSNSRLNDEQRFERELTFGEANLGLKGHARAAGYLGVGWSFPPEFGPGGAEVAMVSGLEDVHQALGVLFATRLGERVMSESFGCQLDAFSLASIDHTLIHRIESAVNDAILKHETRVRLLAVDVAPDDALEGVLRVRVEYEVPIANSRFNMVFPFYLNEATGAGR